MKHPDTDIFWFNLEQGEPLTHFLQEPAETGQLFAGFPEPGNIHILVGNK
jgi:hypothetical protein